MPDMLQIKGQFSVPWSLPDAFGLPYPEAFLFGEGGTTGRRSFGCVGIDLRGRTVPSSGEQLIAQKGIKAWTWHAHEPATHQDHHLIPA